MADYVTEYWLCSYDDGDFDYFDEENGQKISNAMLEHKQTVEVFTLEGSPCIINVKTITNHMFSTKETRNAARDQAHALREEYKEWKQENQVFDE